MAPMACPFPTLTLRRPADGGAVAMDADPPRVFKENVSASATVTVCLTVDRGPALAPETTHDCDTM